MSSAIAATGAAVATNGAGGAIAADEILINDKILPRATLSDELTRLYSQGFLTDITLSTEDGKNFEAHRVLLAARSNYFYSVVQRLKPESAIFLKGIKGSYLDKILKYIYGSSVTLSRHQLKPVLEVARSLQVKGLSEISANDILNRQGLATSESQVPLQRSIIAAGKLKPSSLSHSLQRSSSNNGAFKTPEIPPILGGLGRNRHGSSSSTKSNASTGVGLSNGQRRESAEDSDDSEIGFKNKNAVKTANAFTATASDDESTKKNKPGRPRGRPAKNKSKASEKEQGKEKTTSADPYEFTTGEDKCVANVGVGEDSDDDQEISFSKKNSWRATFKSGRKDSTDSKKSTEPEDDKKKRKKNRKVIAVKCRGQLAELHVAKYGSGARGESIFYKEKWMTPADFDKSCGGSGGSKKCLDYIQTDYGPLKNLAASGMLRQLSRENEDQDEESKAKKRKAQLGASDEHSEEEEEEEEDEDEDGDGETNKHVGHGLIDMKEENEEPEEEVGQDQEDFDHQNNDDYLMISPTNSSSRDAATTTVTASTGGGISSSSGDGVLRGSAKRKKKKHKHRHPSRDMDEWKKQELASASMKAVDNSPQLDTSAGSLMVMASPTIQQSPQQPQPQQETQQQQQQLDPQLVVPIHQHSNDPLGLMANAVTSSTFATPMDAAPKMTFAQGMEQQQQQQQPMQQQTFYVMSPHPSMGTPVHNPFAAPVAPHPQMSPAHPGPAASPLHIAPASPAPSPNGLLKPSTGTPFSRLGNVLNVRCKATTAVLFANKYETGSKGKCILLGEEWYTPNEFEEKAGSKAKKYLSSIKCLGRPLRVYVNSGELKGIGPPPTPKIPKTPKPSESPTSTPPPQQFKHFQLQPQLIQSPMLTPIQAPPTPGHISSAPTTIQGIPVINAQQGQPFLFNNQGGPQPHSIPISHPGNIVPMAFHLAPPPPQPVQNVN